MMRPLCKIGCFSSVALAALAFLPADAAAQPRPLRTTLSLSTSKVIRKPVQFLNFRVVWFAQGKLGQQDGNGECWTLVYDALDAAGAKRPGKDGLGVYQFGRAISLSSIRPGDVLQFEDVTFKHTNSDGSWSTSTFPHHTAIVESVSGSRITLLGQNVNGNRNVQETTIDLNDRQAGGSITAYDPLYR